MQNRVLAFAGLLLNNLSVYRGCEIVFDSKDVPENAIDGASDQPRTARVRKQVSSSYSSNDAYARLVQLTLSTFAHQ